MVARERQTNDLTEAQDQPGYDFLIRVIVHQLLHFWGMLRWGLAKRADGAFLI